VMKKKIIVTIPAYNEAGTIGKVIREIKGVMDSFKYNYKVLVVDDGSTDKTAEIAKKHGAVVYSHPVNYGLADTFRTEMEKCLGLGADIIVHTDADSQYLAAEIPKLLREINNGYDLVLGSRFRGKIERMPLLKRLGNRAFSNVISRLIRTRITDSQTGFRAFTRDVAEKTSIISNFTYTQEQIIRAFKHRFRIKEVPIYFARRKGDGKSRLMSGPFDYAAKAFVNLFRLYRDYDPLKFFGFFGSFFFIIGFILGVWILITLINTGQVGGIPRVVLSALFMITGIQIFLFGFLADMQRK